MKFYTFCKGQFLLFAQLFYNGLVTHSWCSFQCKHSPAQTFSKIQCINDHIMKEAWGQQEDHRLLHETLEEGGKEDGSKYVT